MEIAALREQLKKQAEWSATCLEADLLAIPEEKRTTTFGGCSRGALSIVGDCCRTNEVTANWLLTGVVPVRDPDARAKRDAEYDTTEKMLAWLRHSVEQLKTAHDAMQEQNLLETNSEVIGVPLTRLEIADLASRHMMYHDAQLNYIQTLLGDGAIHWLT
ncbi:MAG: hypothetical protein KGJ62_15285 [Armatimonadetes bacterium]|nr:hypothetical protein [Armatimonadota bacterium]MDE2208001.1 hypothetical protein [Armatimonadota bacterium]